MTPTNEPASCWKTALRRVELVTCATLGGLAEDTDGLFIWNPITNSAHEAEMEAKLRLGVLWISDRVLVGDTSLSIYELYADHPTPQAARRMAGCRAGEAVYLERGK